MKVFMSPGRWAAGSAGLPPAIQQEVLDECVVLYPEVIEGDWQIDQERLADDFARLLREQAGPVPEFVERRGRVLFFVGGKRRPVVAPPPPWQQLGPGVWTAPAGTPPPPDTAWLNVEAFLEESRAADELPYARARRHWLNNWVTAGPVVAHSGGGYFAGRGVI